MSLHAEHLGKVILADWLLNDKLSEWQLVYKNPDGTGEILATASACVVAASPDFLDGVAQQLIETISQRSSH